MEIHKSELKTEQLHDSFQNDYLSVLAKEIESNESLTKTELSEKLELLLIERTKDTDENSKK